MSYFAQRRHRSAARAALQATAAAALDHMKAGRNDEALEAYRAFIREYPEGEEAEAETETPNRS